MTSNGVPVGRRPRALVDCEGNFGLPDGKTANGLVRHSAKYEIVGVVDSRHAGEDSGVVLDRRANGIPLRRDLADALDHLTEVADAYILGLAPASGTLSVAQRHVVLEAIEHGMDVVNGLHQFLGDDAEIAAAARRRGVQLVDVRRPRPKESLRTFTGRIREVTSTRIAVLGTDCAIGKRTTATVLTRTLNAAGVRTVLIGTGQTSMIQGARYGFGLDAVPSQFGAGEMEAVVLEAWDEERPDAMVIEGQGALSHPAYSSTSFILRGSQPQGVILQHAPARTSRVDFPDFAMPTIEREIALVEAFAATRVIGVTLNHEELTDEDVTTQIEALERRLGLPVTDALERPTARLLDMVIEAFPELDHRLTPAFA